VSSGIDVIKIFFVFLVIRLEHPLSAPLILFFVVQKKNSNKATQHKTSFSQVKLILSNPFQRRNLT